MKFDQWNKGIEEILKQAEEIARGLSRQEALEGLAEMLGVTSTPEKKTNGNTSPEESNPDQLSGGGSTHPS